MMVAHPGNCLHLAAFLLFLTHVPQHVATSQEPAVFYVSPAGDDSWSGTLPGPDGGGNDGPFATFLRAREAVRNRSASGLPSTVRIRGGVYRFDRTLLLDSTDSGAKDNPLVWSAFGGEEVHCLGGSVIGGFHGVEDPATLSRIAPVHRSKILVTSLGSQGVTDFGTIPGRLNLYFRGKRMPVARYPNQGWLKIAAVPQSGAPLQNAGDAKVLKNGIPAGRHCGMFQYDGDAPSRWATQSDIWMHGYWVWDWRDAYQKVAVIDTASRLVYPAEPHHGYGYQQGQRYCFLNVLEELDRPGEWSLDETRGLLYFWPPAAIGDGDVTVSLLGEPMVLLDGARHVRILGLTFEGSRACAIKIRGGSDNEIAGCVVRNIDNDTSVIIDGGTRNGIRSCDIYDVGSTGIRVSGGDRTTLTPAGNYAINNHIYRYGCILQSFNGGVYVDGVGNTVAHKRIHDAPFSGIQYYGNDHLIECNELFDLAHESGDVGGINTGGDYSDMGTVIRFNYIHDTHGYGEGGFRGIYLDLPGSNTTIYGNILSNIDIGVFFNSGRDNVVRNNVFFHCHPSVNIYIWPHTSYFHPGGAWKIVEKLHAIGFDRPPYSLRYPKLPSYLDPADLGMPYGHAVVNNISLGGSWLDLSEGIDISRVRVENNVVADSMLLLITRKWTPDYDPYHIGYAAEYSNSDTATAALLTRHGNLLANPGLLDPPGGDFRLREDSPAPGVGFRRIPVETIGLLKDEYRTLLPQ